MIALCILACFLGSVSASRKMKIETKTIINETIEKVVVPSWVWLAGGLAVSLVMFVIMMMKLRSATGNDKYSLPAI